MRRSLRSLLAVCLLASFPAALDAARIEVGADYPLRGEPVSVVVTEGGTRIPDARLVVTYRPNSETRRTEELRVDATGEIDWTPNDAGIVQLQAHLTDDPDAAADATRLVAVRFDGFPASGMTVMTIAGILLFGGALLAFWMLLTEAGPRDTAEEPPST